MNVAEVARASDRALRIGVDGASQTVLSQTDYDWTIRNLVRERTEYGSIVDQTSVVTFEYADLNRLERGAKRAARG